MDEVQQRREPGVQLPRLAGGGVSASALLREAMAEARREFPEAFAGGAPAGLDERELPDAVTAFEVRRGGSGQRLAIARYVTEWVQRRLRFAGEGGESSLEAAFAARGVLPLVSREVSGGRGRDLRAEAAAVVAGLERRPLESTSEARMAAAWAAERVFEPEWMGRNLRGRRFALLGGTAELSPMEFLLSAGAEVFTTARSDERMGEWLEAAAVAGEGGRLWTVRGGCDLLLQPAEIANTLVEEFSQGQPIDVVVLAYEGGRGREWRLSAAMDGIVRRIAGAGMLRSVSYYLSPSVCTEVSRETAEVSEGRFRAEYGLGRRVVNALAGGRLWQGNVVRAGEGDDGRAWSRTVLRYQGASYIAANLFGKVYAAEVYAGGGVAVSANVAPIVRTASTDVGSARVLLEQAEHFGIAVFEPAATRMLMYLLMMADLFGAEGSGAGLFGRQVHGGVFTCPWSLESVVKLAHLRSMLGSMLRRGGHRGASSGDQGLRTR